MTKLTCDNCDAKCCKYLAMEIDTPESRDDFENIRWYVAHKDVIVYVDGDGAWHVEFQTPCEYLGEGNKCQIYKKRPKICKTYSQDECHFHNEYEEAHTFHSIEEIDEYIKEKFKRK